MTSCLLVPLDFLPPFTFFCLSFLVSVFALFPVFFHSPLSSISSLSLSSFLLNFIPPSTHYLLLLMLSFLSLFSLSVLSSSSSPPLVIILHFLPLSSSLPSLQSIFLPVSLLLAQFSPFSSLSLSILLSLSMLPLFGLQFPLCILIVILFPSSLCISHLIPSLPPPFLPFYLLFAILPVFFFPPPFFCPVCPSLFNFSHSLLHPCSLFHTHNLPSVLSALMPSSLLPSSFTSSPPPLSS